MDCPDSNSKCIAYLGDGRICGAPATHLDIQRGGMICDEHKNFAEQQKAEWIGEVNRLTTIYQQRGIDTCIEDAADTIVKLRRRLI
jgi:hypothetical protein